MKIFKILFINKTGKNPGLVSEIIRKGNSKNEVFMNVKNAITPSMKAKFDLKITQLQ